MSNNNFDPIILSFCCNWCSYAGADLAGISRLQYPTNVRIIRVMCSGMVHPNLVIDALTKGADGVIICHRLSSYSTVCKAAPICAAICSNVKFLT